MGRFAKVHPDAHKAALVKAVLDDGLTQAEARRLAMAGELEGCGAFEMSPATISNVIKLAIRDRQPKLPDLVKQGDTDRLVTSVQERLARMLERDLRKLELKGNADPRVIERFASAARSIAQMTAPTPKRGKKAETNGKGGGVGPQDSALLTELQQAASTRTGNGRDSASDTRAASRSTTGAEQQHGPPPVVA